MDAKDGLQPVVGRRGLVPSERLLRVNGAPQLCSRRCNAPGVVDGVAALARASRGAQHLDQGAGDELDMVAFRSRRPGRADGVVIWIVVAGGRTWRAAR